MYFQDAPVDDDVSDGGSAHGSGPAEGEADLAVHVLRVPDVRAVVTVVDRHVDPRAFGLLLCRNEPHCFTIPTETQGFSFFRITVSFSWFRRKNTDTHHVGEVEPWMGGSQMLQQTEELHAVERAPRAVKVVSGFRLLPRVVVVQELVEDAQFPR